MSKCFWSASESPRPCEVKPVYRLTVGHNSEGGTEKRPTGAGSGELTFQPMFTLTPIASLLEADCQPRQMAASQGHGAAAKIRGCCSLTRLCLPPIPRPTL